MSGPKVSVYSVSYHARRMIIARRMRELEELERRRREAEEARQRELKRVAELRGKLTQAKERVASVKANISALSAPAEEVTRHIQGTGLTERIQQLRASLDNVSSLIADSNRLKDSKSLEEALSSVTQQLDKAHEEQEDIKDDISAYDETLEKVLNQKLSDFLRTLGDEPKPEPVQLDESTQAMLADALDLANQKWLPQNLRSELSALRKRAETMPPTSIRSLVEIELMPVMRRCEKYRKTWQDYGEEYDKLYRKYEALAEMNGHAEKVEMVSFGESAIPELKKLIAVEEAQAQEAAERAYIIEALDEVMVEMGYSVWGRREGVRRNGSQFKKSLYQYSSDAAIDVTYASNGQITMELGKMDTSDRLPSKAEEAELTVEMTSFCQDFAEIEKRLAARGVTVGNRVSMAPPSSAYAQIINVNDYEKQEQAVTEKEETRRTVRTTKRTMAVSSDN